LLADRKSREDQVEGPLSVGNVGEHKAPIRHDGGHVKAARQVTFLLHSMGGAPPRQPNDHFIVDAYIYVQENFDKRDIKKHR
jgi:hypothetical protein